MQFAKRFGCSSDFIKHNLLHIQFANFKNSLQIVETSVIFFLEREKLSLDFQSGPHNGGLKKPHSRSFSYRLGSFSNNCLRPFFDLCKNTLHLYQLTSCCLSVIQCLEIRINAKVFSWPSINSLQCKSDTSGLMGTAYILNKVINLMNFSKTQIHVPYSILYSV